MLDIVRQLATELDLPVDRFRSALDLFAEGATQDLNLSVEAIASQPELASRRCAILCRN
ncbi:MAG: hypothetical protein AAFX40_02950 [Cyanobacteria bacterium J06639_1]